MHTFSFSFFFFFSLNLFCYFFVLSCSFFFLLLLLIFQADTSLFWFHFIVENLILHILLIIMIIIPCSGMFRDVPECSMFLILSTSYKPHFHAILKPNTSRNRFLRDRFAFVIGMSARVATMRETAQNKLSQDEEERNCQAAYYGAPYWTLLRTFLIGA